MDYTTRKFINDLAQQVISTYSIRVPVMDIDSIVAKIGGEIEEKDGFDEFCDGSIVKTGDRSFKIAVSTYQNFERRNFTIAHELGHLFLHMGFRTNSALWNAQNQTKYRRFGASVQEYQANEFAAALLMPKDMYRETIRKYSFAGRVDISKVAEYFNVSRTAAINRGKFLGYIE